ncbi:BTB/POZ domain-containing protein SETH6 [Capsicum baccatum]|uniref:BTB/POZ domain-containing protein SETH6 n=1 Tax=Capsicum baccatum TaxID=33114 RepID=A0A2G2VLX2_CAPBA|nr:BTB/POZ domain-containing protein SETH6 [Capsicum baccatum]
MQSPAYSPDHRKLAYSVETPSLSQKNSLSESPDFSTDDRPHSSAGSLWFREVEELESCCKRQRIQRFQESILLVFLADLMHLNLLKVLHGVTVEITISNVALLRCAAKFKEMTEDISEKNMEIRTEVFFKDAVFSNISNSISILYRCKTLLLVSEEVNLVS